MLTNKTQPLKIASTPGIVTATAGLHPMVNCAVEQARLVHKCLAMTCCLLASSTNAFSAGESDRLSKEDVFSKHPVYAGGTIGYGSTTWQGLVPAESKQNIAISLSAPIAANEGGMVWGAFAGYEFTPYFALEANYLRYPSATLTFDEASLFTFDYNEQTSLKTSTEVAYIMGKFMLLVPHTNVRAYSGLGLANLHRDDFVNEQWKVTPTFGAGLNYNLAPHLMSAIEFNYTAGYGEAEVNPINSFVPFLYSIYFKFAYRV